MKTTTVKAAIGSAILLLDGASSQHHHHHQHQHRQIHHQHHHTSKRDIGIFGASNATSNPRYESRLPEKLQARGGGAKCEFPTSKGLFAVTPGSLNGGWALAPDQECVDGTWCPIACPPGQVMAQWKPGTTYTYPESTYGGIHCNNGKIEVPFEDKPWCVDGTGTVEAVNNAGDVVSFCQTVLPGYEDMIIPTDVHDSATLAVPDPSYWDSTASHFYINAPGVGSDEGCHWGDETKPIGNWAPYVAGANTDGSGNTFVKLGLNPVWQSSSLATAKPTFGLKIECDGNCNGLPCEIDGSGVISNEKATGAGGSDFCVVTVSDGGKASIVVYNLDGSGGDGGDSDESTSSAESTPTSTSTSTPTPTPTTTSTPSTTSVPTTTSTPSTTSEPSTSTPESTTTSSSDVSTSSSASSSSSSSSAVKTSYSVSPSSSSSVQFYGAVYHQNGTSTADHSSNSPTGTSALPTGSTSGSQTESGGASGSESESSSSESSKSENAGRRQDGAAVAGLIVAFVAAVYLI